MSKQNNLEMTNSVLTNLAPEVTLRPALCLDLDGTVRRTKSGKPFIESVEDIELMPGIEDKIWSYRDVGFLIIGISNQAGVAYGFKRPSHVEKELSATFDLFEKNPFHIVKQCYHMEGGKVEPFCHRSMLRKPNIGMLALAEFEAWNNGYMIDWNNSLFVGDRPEDEQCAKNADLKFIHINDFLKTPEP